MPGLMIIAGPDECRGKVLAFPDGGQGRMVVGRNAGPLQIHDLKVSREHAEVFMVQGVWHIRDLGSRNGTFVGSSQALADRAIRLDSDVDVCIGRCRLRWIPETPLPKPQPEDMASPACDDTAESDDGMPPIAFTLTGWKSRDESESGEAPLYPNESEALLPLEMQAPPRHDSAVRAVNDRMLALLRLPVEAHEKPGDGDSPTRTMAHD